MSSNKKIQRNFGLDIIRSFAIIMVFIGHLIPDNISNKYIYSVAMIFRGIGVELFFVLSGFLIGKILIKLFNKNLNLSNIAIFYKRRWLRTLPLYFLYLFLCILLLKASSPETNIFSVFYLKYLFFVQNFDIRHLSFFNHSWSLAIEEWFYLLLPWVLVVIKEREKFSQIKFMKISPSNKESLYIDLIKIIIFIAAIRFLYVYAANISDIDFALRRQIPIRMDALLTGVLFACLKINNKEIYDKFLTLNSVIISFCVLGVLMFYLGCFIYIKPTITPLFLTTLFWSVLSFSFAIIIIFFEDNKFINNKLSKIFFMKQFFEKTSIYSYSIYLFHWLIICLYSINYNNLENSLLGIFLCIATIYILSAFLHRYFEKPIMDLREKI